MAIEIKNKKILCCKGSGEYNEDIAGITKSGAWVLDGATGLNNKNIVSKESDAKWYVEWWNNFLKENICKSISLKDIIKNGINEVEKEYKSRIQDLKIEKLDRPSCSSAIIKFHKNKIEYLILGDCTLLSENSNICLKDDSVCELDEIVFESMSKIKNVDKMDFSAKRDKVLSIIIENRLKKNTKEGYWILGFNKEAVENAIYGFIDIKDETSIILTSDGFSCAFDRYNLIKKNEVFSIIKDKGVDYIYDKVREIEEDDLNGIKYPRFKISDDSSCIYLNIVDI